MEPNITDILPNGFISNRHNNFASFPNTDGRYDRNEKHLIENVNIINDFLIHKHKQIATHSFVPVFRNLDNCFVNTLCRDLTLKLTTSDVHLYHSTEVNDSIYTHTNDTQSNHEHHSMNLNTYQISDFETPNNKDDEFDVSMLPPPPPPPIPPVLTSISTRSTLLSTPEIHSVTTCNLPPIPPLPPLSPEYVNTSIISCDHDTSTTVTNDDLTSATSFHSSSTLSSAELKRIDLNNAAIRNAAKRENVPKKTVTFGPTSYIVYHAESEDSHETQLSRHTYTPVSVGNSSFSSVHSGGRKRYGRSNYQNLNPNYTYPRPSVDDDTYDQPSSSPHPNSFALSSFIDVDHLPYNDSRVRSNSSAMYSPRSFTFDCGGSVFDRLMSCDDRMNNSNDDIDVVYSDTDRHSSSSLTINRSSSLNNVNSKKLSIFPSFSPVDDDFDLNMEDLDMEEEGPFDDMADSLFADSSRSIDGIIQTCRSNYHAERGMDVNDLDNSDHDTIDDGLCEAEINAKANLGTSSRPSHSTHSHSHSHSSPKYTDHDSSVYHTPIINTDDHHAYNLQDRPYNGTPAILGGLAAVGMYGPEGDYSGTRCSHDIDVDFCSPAVTPECNYASEDVLGSGSRSIPSTPYPRGLLSESIDDSFEFQEDIGVHIYNDNLAIEKNHKLNRTAYKMDKAVSQSNSKFNLLMSKHAQNLQDNSVMNTTDSITLTPYYSSFPHFPSLHSDDVSFSPLDLPLQTPHLPKSHTININTPINTPTCSNLSNTVNTTSTPCMSNPSGDFCLDDDFYLMNLPPPPPPPSRRSTVRISEAPPLPLPPSPPLQSQRTSASCIFIDYSMSSSSPQLANLTPINVLSSSPAHPHTPLPTPSSTRSLNRTLILPHPHFDVNDCDHVDFSSDPLDNHYVCPLNSPVSPPTHSSSSSIETDLSLSNDDHQKNPTTVVSTPLTITNTSITAINGFGYEDCLISDIAINEVDGYSSFVTPLLSQPSVPLSTPTNTSLSLSRSHSENRTHPHCGEEMYNPISDCQPVSVTLDQNYLTPLNVISPCTSQSYNFNTSHFNVNPNTNPNSLPVLTVNIDSQNTTPITSLHTTRSDISTTSSHIPHPHLLHSVNVFANGGVHTPHPKQMTFSEDQPLSPSPHESLYPSRSYNVSYPHLHPNNCTNIHPSEMGVTNTGTFTKVSEGDEELDSDINMFGGFDHGNPMSNDSPVSPDMYSQMYKCLPPRNSEDKMLNTSSTPQMSELVVTIDYRDSNGSSESVYPDVEPNQLHSLSVPVCGPSPHQGSPHVSSLSVDVDSWSRNDIMGRTSIISIDSTASACCVLSIGSVEWSRSYPHSNEFLLDDGSLTQFELDSGFPDPLHLDSSHLSSHLSPPSDCGDDAIQYEDGLDLQIFNEDNAGHVDHDNIDILDVDLEGLQEAIEVDSDDNMTAFAHLSSYPPSSFPSSVVDGVDTNGVENGGIFTKDVITEDVKENNVESKTSDVDNSPEYNSEDIHEIDPFSSVPETHSPHSLPQLDIPPISSPHVVVSTMTISDYSFPAEDYSHTHDRHSTINESFFKSETDDSDCDRLSSSSIVSTELVSVIVPSAETDPFSHSSDVYYDLNNLNMSSEDNQSSSQSDKVESSTFPNGLDPSTHNTSDHVNDHHESTVESNSIESHIIESGSTESDLPTHLPVPQSECEYSFHITHQQINSYAADVELTPFLPPSLLLSIPSLASIHAALTNRVPFVIHSPYLVGGVEAFASVMSHLRHGWKNKKNTLAASNRLHTIFELEVVYDRMKNTCLDHTTLHSSFSSLSPPSTPLSVSSDTSASSPHPSPFSHLPHTPLSTLDVPYEKVQPILPTSSPLLPLVDTRAVVSFSLHRWYLFRLYDRQSLDDIVLVLKYGSLHPTPESELIPLTDDQSRILEVMLAVIQYYNQQALKVAKENFGLEEEYTDEEVSNLTHSFLSTHVIFQRVIASDEYNNRILKLINEMLCSDEADFICRFLMDFCLRNHESSMSINLSLDPNVQEGYWSFSTEWHDNSCEEAFFSMLLSLYNNYYKSDYLDYLSTFSLNTNSCQEVVSLSEAIPPLYFTLFSLFHSPPPHLAFLVDKLIHTLISTYDILDNIDTSYESYDPESQWLTVTSITAKLLDLLINNELGTSCSYFYHRLYFFHSSILRIILTQIACTLYAPVQCNPQGIIVLLSDMDKRNMSMLDQRCVETNVILIKIVSEHLHLIRRFGWLFINRSLRSSINLTSPTYNNNRPSNILFEDSESPLIQSHSDLQSLIPSHPRSTVTSPELLIRCESFTSSHRADSHDSHGSTDSTQSLDGFDQDIYNPLSLGSPSLIASIPTPSSPPSASLSPLASASTSATYNCTHLTGANPNANDFHATYEHYQNQYSHNSVSNSISSATNLHTVNHLFAGVQFVTFATHLLTDCEEIVYNLSLHANYLVSEAYKYPDLSSVLEHAQSICDRLGDVDVGDSTDSLSSSSMSTENDNIDGDNGVDRVDGGVPQPSSLTIDNNLSDSTSSDDPNDTSHQDQDALRKARKTHRQIITDLFNKYPLDVVSPDECSDEEDPSESNLNHKKNTSNEGSLKQLRASKKHLNSTQEDDTNSHPAIHALLASLSLGIPGTIGMMTGICGAKVKLEAPLIKRMGDRLLSKLLYGEKQDKTLHKYSERSTQRSTDRFNDSLSSPLSESSQDSSTRVSSTNRSSSSVLSRKWPTHTVTIGSRSLVTTSPYLHSKYHTLMPQTDFSSDTAAEASDVPLDVADLKLSCIRLSSLPRNVEKVILRFLFPDGGFQQLDDAADYLQGLGLAYYPVLIAESVVPPSVDSFINRAQTNIVTSLEVQKQKMSQRTFYVLTHGSNEHHFIYKSPLQTQKTWNSNVSYDDDAKTSFGSPRKLKMSTSQNSERYNNQTFSFDNNESLFHTPQVRHQSRAFSPSFTPRSLSQHTHTISRSLPSPSTVAHQLCYHPQHSSPYLYISVALHYLNSHTPPDDDEDYLNIYAQESVDNPYKMYVIKESHDIPMIFMMPRVIPVPTKLFYTLLHSSLISTPSDYMGDSLLLTTPTPIHQTIFPKTPAPYTSGPNPLSTTNDLLDVPSSGSPVLPLTISLSLSSHTPSLSRVQSVVAPNVVRTINGIYIQLKSTNPKLYRHKSQKPQFSRLRNETTYMRQEANGDSSDGFRFGVLSPVLIDALKVLESRT